MFTNKQIKKIEFLFEKNDFNIIKGKSKLEDNSRFTFKKENLEVNVMAIKSIFDGELSFLIETSNNQRYLTSNYKKFIRMLKLMIFNIDDKEENEIEIARKELLSLCNANHVKDSIDRIYMITFDRMSKSFRVTWSDSLCHSPYRFLSPEDVMNAINKLGYKKLCLIYNIKG